MPIIQGALQPKQGLIYDTIFLPENLCQRTCTAFCIPVGQYAGRLIKQFEHTNMLMAAMLPSPEKFTVQKISIAIKDGYGFIGTENRWWDGEGKLQIYGESQILRLRELADKTLPQRIQYWMSATEAFARNFPTIEPDQKIPVLANIDTQMYFHARFELDHDFNVPMELQIALEGVHWMAAF